MSNNNQDINLQQIVIDTPQPNNSSNSSNSSNTSSSSSSSNTSNNWTVDNCNIISTWKENLEKSIYIYSYILNYNSKRLHSFLLYSLIVSTIVTLLSSISTTMMSLTNQDDTTTTSSTSISNNNKVSFYISIMIFCLNGLNVILVGVVKIYNWNVQVNTLTAYIEKINSLYYTISCELLLPSSSRINFNSFITKNSTTFLNITQHAPEIDNIILYDKAELMYKQFVDKKKL